MSKVRLEEELTRKRVNEMDKYGRSDIYHKIQTLLSGERLRTFDLVNHGLAMVDDVLDLSTQPLEYLKHIQQIFQQSFSGARVESSTPEERAVVDLGYTLNRLTSKHFTDRAIGRHTYEEVLNFWQMETRNFQRQWQILDKKTLDEITLGVGSLVASQFLFILDPPSDPYEFISLAKTYGLAVKLADNLCDFREDIQRGFVNVPKEDIHHVNGICVEDSKVTQINPGRLSLSVEYIRKEYERIQQIFKSADNLLLRARLHRPIWNSLGERLYLFGQLCHSWLDQARDFEAKKVTRDF